MVQAKGVEPLKARAQSRNPPVISPLSQKVPAIEGVPPELARLAEIIRRNPGHHRGPSTGVEPEEFLVRPEVGALEGDVDGQVPDESDPPLQAVSLELGPLAEEEKLEEPVVVDLPGELLPGAGERGGAPQPELLPPPHPGAPPPFRLEGAEEGVVREPGLVLPAKPLKLGLHLRVPPPPEGLEGFPQARELEARNRAVVHPAG